MTTDSRTGRDTRLAVLAHVLAAAGLASEISVLVVAIPRHDGIISWSPEITVFTVITLAVGWILAWKRPRITLSWIVLAIALLATGGPSAALAVATLHSAPDFAVWLLWYGGLSQWSWIPPIGLLLTQLPLRFPNGRLPSPGWRWFSWFTILALAVACFLGAVTGERLSKAYPNPAYLGWGEDAAGAAIGIALLLLGAAVVGSVASLFVRYRRADAVERVQLRWIFLAVAIVAGILLLSWVENSIFGDNSTPGIAGAVARTWDYVGGLSYSLIPLSILFAVLRSGLYAIDRIISRTAAYAIVTLSVVIVYGSVVLVASVLLPDAPSVSVALATLVAAAVFLPLLRFVRRSVDRRFNRAQYDAQKVVDAFGERIRNGADPHTAGADLIDAIESTLQPGSVGIWTRSSAG